MMRHVMFRNQSVRCIAQIACRSGAAKCYSTRDFTFPLIKGKKTPKKVSAEEAVKCLKSDYTVFIQGAAATPLALIGPMTEFGKANKLKNILVCHMHTEGNAPYCDPSCEGIFRSVSFFMGANVRKAVAEGRATSIPVFLSEIPSLFYKQIIKPDIALIHVSPPDKHGYCSLGTSVDCVMAALMYCKIVIAQVNKKMPRILGDGALHVTQLDYMVDVDAKLPGHAAKPPSPEEAQIGKHIAESLVKDGSTLQMGIGNIPDAVLSACTGHKDLGIHSEMFSDGVADLVEKGCITNNKKILDRGMTIGSFLIGSQKLYDYVDDNPTVNLKIVDYVNDHKIIGQQPNMVAINSCIEIDLTGQSAADSIGTRMYSGFGGQVDFIRAAGDAEDMRGIPIIAVQSQTAKGASKIVPTTLPGAGIVTSRGHMQYVVTEYGIANMYGKTLIQRARALIDIAHPNHREKLEKAAFDRYKTMPKL